MARLHVVQSRNDNAIAARFIDPLKKAGHSVSVDFNYLVPGVEWNRSLREAVRSADGLLAVLSEHSIDRISGRITSQWIAADIGAARASGKFLIPVLVGKACPIPTLVDDLFAIRLTQMNDQRAFKEVLRQIQDAIAYHLERRTQEAALALPPGYQHLASSVLRCREDIPYDKSVFVMMKFPDESLMEPKELQMLGDIWETISSELARVRLTARRADHRAYEDQLWENICVYMLSSRYGIAVLEDRAADELNPNVTLEYGFMKAMNRKVALLRDINFKHDRADLTGKLAKSFEIEKSGRVNKESLRKAVRQWLADVGAGSRRKG